MQNTSNPVAPAAITLREESYNWVIAKARGGNIFALYVHAWLRSDRAGLLNQGAQAWLKGVAGKVGTPESAWAKALLVETDQSGRYSFAEARTA